MTVQAARRPASLAVLAVALASAATFAACIDLFHDTDFPTLCDAHPERCVAESGAAFGPLCTVERDAARAQAVGACVRLGACAGPLGRNAFGPCMVEALSAYDCNTRPERPVHGDVEALFRCLSEAKTCDSTRQCVFPKTAPLPCDCASGGCGASFLACQEGDNAAVRFVCPANGGPPSIVEPCTLQGSSCARSSAAAARCGSSGSCAPGCEQGVARSCDEASEDAKDCRYFGAGTCLETPFGGRCAPSSRVECAVTPEVRCQDGVARSCVTGFEETVDCTRFGMTCAPLAVTPLDLSLACSNVAAAEPISDAGTDSGGPSGASSPTEPCEDRCNAGSITGCVRGAAFTATCSDFGFASCTLEEVPAGSTPLPLVHRARCVP